MTVGDRHPCKQAGLHKVLNLLKSPQRLELYFDVRNDKFETFRFQRSEDVRGRAIREQKNRKASRHGHQGKCSDRATGGLVREESKITCVGSNAEEKCWQRRELGECGEGWNCSNIVVRNGKYAFSTYQKKLH